MIKLFKVGETEDGTIRLQSQLSLGRDSVDFILENNVLKNWKFVPQKGIGFHEVNIPYQIVENKEEMRYQPL